MNRKEHIHVDKVRGDVVDLKSLSRARRTPIPEMIAREVRRYPAQAPTRVFATPSHPSDMSPHATSSRVEKVHTSEIRDTKKATTNAYPNMMTLAHEPRKREARHLWKSSRAQRFFSRIVAGLLVPMMLIHPVARVYADEVAVETVPTIPTEEIAAPPVEEASSAVSAEASPAVSENPATDAPATSFPSDDLQNEEGAETPPTYENNESDVTPSASASELPPQNEGGEGGSTGGGFGSGSTTDGDTGTTTDATDAPSEIATSTSEDMASTTLDVDGLEGDGVDIDSDIDLNASSTEEVTDENAPIEGEESAVMQKSAEEIAADDALRTERIRTELRREVEQEFLRGCISFETSGYYCLNDGARKSAPTTTAKVITTVESVEGNGGDKEIFVVKNGVRTALTANDWDDAFPTQDISGDRFVWQGMKGGRWQIFVGSLSASGTVSVSQLTDSRESNFNPKIDGEHIVWQGWADENWEIFIATKRDADSPFAGEHLPEGNALLNVGNDWAVERLTANSEHDMFPSLHGDIVTWQSREGSDWVVNAYSIAQKNLTQLSTDGAKGENPRFALTWEERDQEGRTRLVGYDIATGEKTDITSKSLQLPTSPYVPEGRVPTTQTDQATLPPPASNGSSTPSRGDDDDSGDNPVLP